jgi:hypothetical protein
LRCEPLEDRQLLSVNPNVLWADYLGGSSVDYGFSVAIDPAGNALVTGQTSAGFTGVSGNHGGVSDAFVAKFDGNGSLVWVTYLGGSGGDSGRGIAVDGAGNALVTGQTSSTDFAGPNGSLANGSLQGTNDAFVAKVNSDGTLAWATYLGGSSGDSGTGIAFDPNGNAMVTGSTTSADFAGATGNHGGNDAFVAKVWSDGTQPDGTVAWATYLGGSGSDVANGIAVDTNGNALVAGQTMSTDFAGPNGPLANGSLQGTSDAFVA